MMWRWEYAGLQGGAGGKEQLQDEGVEEEEGSPVEPVD
jgi:hypothetical protein